MFKSNKNVRVLLTDVTGFHLAGNRVLLGPLPNGDAERAIACDSLIVAAGSVYWYFGHGSVGVLVRANIPRLCGIRAR